MELLRQQCSMPPWQRELLLRKRATGATSSRRRVRDPAPVDMKLPNERRARCAFERETAFAKFAKPDEDGTSDSSEELEYGPGIVNKLKTKYLSMTLRESKKNVRPSLSNLRKSSSLDNLLEDEATEKPSCRISSVISCVNKLEYKDTSITVNFSADLKRTRSMDTLHDECKTKPVGKSVKVNPILDSVANENVIVVENSVSEVKHADKHRPPDLPPPDLVKETMKIFENGAKPGRKSWTVTAKITAPVAPKPAKPVIYPKPNINDPKFKVKKQPMPLEPLNSPEKTNGYTMCTKFTEADEKPRFSFGGRVENGFGQKEPTRQIGVIRPLIAVQPKMKIPDKNGVDVKPIQSNIPNGLESKSFDEAKSNGFEKMIVNKPKSLEIKLNESKPNNFEGKPVNGVVKECPVVNSPTKPSSLWVNKSPFNQQNTMVFNFSNRKEVPDYIENDGLLMTSNRERVKKILKETGGTGYIILGMENGIGLGDESSTDSANTSCEEEWSLIAGPPSPCNVHFEGDNVLINGKSNLRKQPKEKKLRIQFNDTSTTFEYPSEASLLEDESTCIPNGDQPLAASSPEPIINGIPSSTAKIPSPLGGGSLASYVPKLNISDGFELGVTRTSAVASPEKGKCSNEDAENLSTTMENDNVAWSEESIPDLLF